MAILQTSSIQIPWVGGLRSIFLDTGLNKVVFYLENESAGKIECLVEHGIVLI